MFQVTKQTNNYDSDGLHNGIDGDGHKGRRRVTVQSKIQARQDEDPVKEKRGLNLCAVESEGDSKLSQAKCLLERQVIDFQGGKQAMFCPVGAFSGEQQTKLFPVQ